MRTKTTMLFSSVILAVLATTTAALRFPQFQGEKMRQEQLLQTNAKLQKRLAQIHAELSADGADDGKIKPAQRSAWDDSGTIPLKLDLIKKMPIQAVELRDGGAGPRELKLSQAAIGLLAMSPEETKQVQSTFYAMQDYLEKYARTNIQPATLEQAAQYHLFDFMDVYTNRDSWFMRTADDEEYLKAVTPAAANPGVKSAYEIPAMNPDDFAAMHKWLADSLTDELGPDRAEILQKTLAFNEDFWPYAKQHCFIAFIDQTDPQTGETRTEWTVVNAGGVVGNARNGGTSADAVPPILAYLFQPVTGDPNVRREIIH